MPRSPKLPPKPKLWSEARVVAMLTALLGGLLVASLFAGANPAVYWMLSLGLAVGVLRLVLGPRITTIVRVTSEVMNAFDAVYLVFVIVVAIIAGLAWLLGSS